MERYDPVYSIHPDNPDYDEVADRLLRAQEILDALSRISEEPDEEN